MRRQNKRGVHKPVGVAATWFNDCEIHYSHFQHSGTTAERNTRRHGLNK